SRPYSVRGADRTTFVGVDRSSVGGFAAGDRGARARDRERTQGTMYTIEQEYPYGPGHLDERTAHVPRSALVPERTWGPSERARCALPISQTRRPATTTCPSLKQKRVSPHVLRHTTAMD